MNNISKHSYEGLDEAQVLASRAAHGSNVLTPPAKEPLWRQFMHKFSDPLIVILLIAGVLSVGISFYEYYGLGQTAAVFFEPVGIFVAIFLATGLAFYFELQADKEFAVLNQVNDDEPVEVVRGGNATQVARRDVVVGDVVVLCTGQEVPADCQLLEAVALHVDESTLTGEPMCAKSVRPEDADPQATYPTDHVMKGTKIMEGHGVGRVTAVGDHTEQGRVYEAAQIDDGMRTPLDEQLDRLGRWVAWASYAIGVLIVIGRIAMYLVENGTSCFASISQAAPFVAYVLQTLMIAVTLVVVAVPEGLPMAVTLSLAYSMRRMLKTNNLVRRMHACETMGAATVICTDKTGTLTQNRMAVDQMTLYGGVAEDMVDEAVAVNSTASIDFSEPDHPQVLGNPTEGALLMWLWGRGVDYRVLRADATVIDEVPFSTERKYMATVVASAVEDGRRVLYVKGAPEIVLAMCEDMDPDDREDVERRMAECQDRAMRTLGLACRVLADGERAVTDGKVVARGLTFVGLAAIADPVRLEVPAAVDECRRAGISVKIVTGDTPGTARQIARQIGLWDDDSDGERNIMTGPQLAALSDDELQSRADELKIIARARPMDKKRLVEALQREGQVVAVTGDGTNDAPALKAAHVGLSMGDGTSVAKEASDITIIDNSFGSIGKAVMWGRSLYRNIQRFLLFQLTVNVTACLLVLCGAFMGTESPLTVTQMLWINLIMDTFAAMALASLPPSESVMDDAPRNRRDFILTRPMMVEIVGVGGFFFVMLLVMLYVFQHADISCMADLVHVRLGQKGHVSAYELTLLFTTFVMTHFFYLFDARAFGTGRSALHFKGCNGLLTIVAIILVGQVAMVEVPGMQQFFNVVGLRLDDWVVIILGSSLVLWVREGWHLLFEKKRY